MFGKATSFTEYGDTILQRPGGLHRTLYQGQKEYVKAIRENPLVFGIGPAGTGKTYIAVAMAVAAFKKKQVDRIILTRPAAEAERGWDSARRHPGEGQSVP